LARYLGVSLLAVSAWFREYRKPHPTAEVLGIMEIALQAATMERPGASKRVRNVGPLAKDSFVIAVIPGIDFNLAFELFEVFAVRTPTLRSVYE
jgi:hypothetical protein